jgi:hypothetical protein
VNIKKATQRYEDWLADNTPLIPTDLALKHAAMAEDPFSFFRATFYRWVQLWRKIGSELGAAPLVLAVGDLHVENFGTWRDSEGRLIWGINDFDESYHMPYPIDLVRLAASAQVAITANQLTLSPKDACDAILTGYTEALAKGGQPFVLSEHFGWLRALALNELRDPVRYWQKMEALPTVRTRIPRSAVKALERGLPAQELDYRLASRVAGLGSLGRQRFVALAEWRGGQVARETKAMAPSAYIWEREHADSELFYQVILDQAVRCPDPFVRLRGRWILRRLAPDCSRIELASLPKERDEARLLHAMGWETANIHLGSRGTIDAVRRHLRKQPAGWLHTVSERMVDATLSDFHDWKRAMAGRLKARHKQ